MDGKPEDNNKRNQREIRGIHLGFFSNSEGIAPLCSVYKADCHIWGCHLGWNLCIHCGWDLETFSWNSSFQTHCLIYSWFICCVEHTGDLLSQFEEGNARADNNQTATTSFHFEEDIIHSDLISDPDEDSSEEEVTNGIEENNEEAGSSDIVPQIVEDGLDSNNVSDMELFTACQVEDKEPPIILSAADPSPFMLPPMGIRSVLKISDLKVREAWLRAYQKEIKILIDAKTFALDKPKDGEPVIPTMETNKVKIKSDGSLDKLKCRIVARGDLQDTAI